MDTFYRVEDFDTKVSILKDAYRVATEWWVDKLDCNVSWAREQIDMSFEEIMKKFKEDSHFVVIQRNLEWYGEIGFRAMSGIDYFLFIHISVEDLEKIINKYNLKPF